MILIIKEEMAKHDVHVLKSVKLEIGKLSAVVPASLLFCFSIMTKGTNLEGAELIMEMIPLKATCTVCGETFEIIDHTFICPHCESRDIETIAGQELTIVEIHAS
ncbi:MAG: hydrogenase maturation nickel metallochaperone HypA [Deltaproteobacteria bacterium]|nr:hydrogenase maturation nickel metallochaperone HypA [Deltaproteobacteria bacterium]